MKKTDLVLGALLLSASAQAALLASDSFEYDTTLGGIYLSNTVYQGGTGWAAGGSYPNWEATFADGLRLDSSSGGLGNSLGDTNSVGNRCLSVGPSANARTLAAGFNLDSDHYTAFLARTDSATGAFRIECSYTTPSKSVRWKPFELNSDGTIETQAGTINAASASPVWSDNTTYLVVSKWEASGDHSYTRIFDIYAGTDYLTEVDWVNDADVHADGLSGVTIQDIYMTASTAGVSIDEFKVGTTYADVVRNYTGEGPPPPYIVFAHEAFDYLPGSVLSGGGLNGGTGWVAGWQASAGGGLPLHYTTESLWFGNTQAFSEDGSCMIDSGAGKGSERELDVPIPLDGTNLYFAVLVRKLGDPSARFVFYDGASVAANVGFADYDGEGDNPDLFVSPSEDLYPAAQYAADALGPDNHLLVMKRTGTDISASLIPGDGSTPTEPVIWDVTDSGATVASVNRLGIVVSSGTLRMDEIGIGSTFDAAVADLPIELPPPPAPPRQETVGYAVDQPLTTEPKSWTYAVKEGGDYQLGMAWVEAESGHDVAVEIFTNGTHRIKALYAPAGEVTRFETRIENLAAGDTIKVKVSPNGGTYRAGYRIAFTTPTFTGLPVFDVASYGAVGDGTTDDFYAIQSAVTAAKNAGGGIVQFDGSKTYRTMGLSDFTSETLIDLEEADNIKVEGNGALIVLHPPDRFANIEYAENIQVDGFTIDYDPIPYYQGTITDINLANMTIDIDVPERYPLPEVGAVSNQNQTGLGPFFGRSFIPDYPGARSGRGANIYVESTALNGGPRKVRIQVPDTVGGVSMLPRLQEAYDNNATEFVVPHLLYGHRNGMTQIYGSSRVKLSNLQYYNMAHFWLGITQNDGPITLSNVDLEVRDPATELLASWRDGMHIKNGRWGILIEEGDWDGASMYDDTFAIYSRRQVVVSADGHVATLAPSVYNRESWLWQPGDWASFWSPNQETFRGMARVVGVRDLELPNYEVTFESLPLGVSADDVVLHEESLNRGTLIRNCRTTSVGTEDASTRLRGTDMRFENNHFEDFGFRLEWADELGTPRARDVVVKDTYLSSVNGDWVMSRPLGVLFKDCIINGLAPYVHLGADDVLFDGVAWSNMTGDILSVLGSSHAWLFGGSSRNGSTSGLFGYVSTDGSSTVTYSAPAGYPPAEPPSGGDITPPLAPVLTAATSGGTVVLDWTDSSGAAAYTVYRRTSTDGLYSRLLRTLDSSHVDTSAVIGQTSFYVVTATDDNGNESAFSNEDSAVPAGTILAPVADAYVESGSSANGNFGSSPTLKCKTDPAGNFTREAYLRFNLSSFSGFIAQAVLRLNAESTTGSGDIHTAHFVGDDSWGESTIKWNAKPAAGAALDSAVSPPAGSWLELDLTDQTAIEWAGDQFLSTVLISSGEELVDYSSKEAAHNQPELAIATMDALPPVPPTDLMVTAVEGSRELSLSWADQSGSGVSHYGVYRSTTPGGPYTHWINTTANAYVDTDIELLKTYYYVVTAINTDGYASGFSSETSATPVALVLQPVADAFVQGGSYANDNYGTNTVLLCKTDIDNSSYNREPYLRFDLSSLSGPVVSATLRLNVESLNGSGDTHALYFVSDDSWGETTINWYNKPAAGTLLDAAPLPAASSWIELDVTGQVAAEQAGDQLFSAVLISDGAVLAGYHSKEADVGNRPELVIETGPSGYSLWADEYQLVYGPDGHDDADGLANLYEYGVGGDPTNAFDTGFPVQLRFEGTNGFFVHPQLSDPLSGIRYYLELSDNLVSNVWTTNGYVVAGSLADGYTNGLDAVTNLISTESKNEQFIRLSIEEK